MAKLIILDLRKRIFRKLVTQANRFSFQRSVSPAATIPVEERIHPPEFDPRWYLEVNGDVAVAGVNPFTHFIAFGESEDRDPNPHFSTRYYRATYMRGEPVGASPLTHYIEQGRAVGYDPDPQNAGNYSRFVSAQEQSYALEIQELHRHIEAMIIRPLFIIFLDSKEDRVLQCAREALAAQIYSDWIFCNDVDDVLYQAKRAEVQDWRLIWLDSRDFLHSSALYCYASLLNAIPSADVMYADEDEIDDQGHRRRPFFKPDWSPDYFESFNFIGTGACVSGSVCAMALRDIKSSYDLLLRATEAACRIEHVRQVLIHRRAGLDQRRSSGQIAEEVSALQRRLSRTGRSGVITAIYPDHACYGISLKPAAKPLVSVVIPTAGKILNIDGRKVDLLFNCLDLFVARSTYKNVELVVVHNNDLGEARLSCLIARGIKVLGYQGEFNVARKLNIGAAASDGDLLLLLNDDVEPITPDWIERMVEHFEKPHVGIVGAKLLFPTMQIQHAGIVITDGRPGHVRLRYPRSDRGYFFSTCAVRNFSAVTGAVMMTRATLYRKLCGYDEEFPNNFNDVDYCLRAGKYDYTTVYAPEVELIHYETASRVREVKAIEVEHFEKRWASITIDRYYNQTMLNNKGPDYKIVPSSSPIG